MLLNKDKRQNNDLHDDVTTWMALYSSGSMALYLHSTGQTKCAFKTSSMTYYIKATTGQQVPFLACHESWNIIREGFNSRFNLVTRRITLSSSSRYRRQQGIRKGYSVSVHLLPFLSCFVLNDLKFFFLLHGFFSITTFSCLA